jgi:hypothetical protein
MTYQDDFPLPTELLEQIASEGLGFLPELVWILVNAAMQLERQKHLGAGPYERTPERYGYAKQKAPCDPGTHIAPCRLCRLASRVHSFT